MSDVRRTQSLRAFVTHAEFSSRLLAPPTAYDLPPSYVLDNYRQGAAAIGAELAAQLRNPRYEEVTSRDLRKDARIALQLVAPIALGSARAYLIGSSLVACAANPVMLLLGGPALLLTGHKVLADLRRAFVVDPQIRAHVQAAHEAAARSDFVSADQRFKDALAVDVDPSNARNADVYLHQGLLYMQHGRPRQALISFCKASVLMSERETVHEGGRSVSKRGFTELLALACLDSFAKDEGGLDEWNEIAKDLASSALVRFERYADAKDEGALFGLFGVDPDSAYANRGLMAKVRFLQAKMQSRRNIALAGTKQALRTALNEGLALLRDDTSLSQRERAMAMLEQAQFYFSATTRKGHVDSEMLCIALALVAEAADSLRADDESMALFASAEAISFALTAIPPAVKRGDPGAAQATAVVTQWLERLADRLEERISVDGADDYLQWAYEQLYRLHVAAPSKRRVLERAARVARRRGDSVAELHACLRGKFLRDSSDDEPALHAALEAVRRHPDALVSAFGSKYSAEMLEGEAAQAAFADAARSFAQAAQAARDSKQVQPFMLQGHVVAHDFRQAAVVLHTLEAYCWLRAKNGPGAFEALDAAEALVVRLDDPHTHEMFEGLRAAARMLADPIAGRAALERALTVMPPGDPLAPWLKALLDGAAQDRAPEAAHAPVPRSNASRLDEFASRREVLDRVLSDLGALSAEAEAHELAEGTASLRDKLASGRFSLAVVGEFSTGKSTFINAMLGTRALPSAARPTTAAVNRITWGAQAGATVHFGSGSTQDIELKELSEYVTERKNPGNTKGVASVTVNHSLPLLRHGITILDTPGISSLIKSHTELTYQTIPSCDGVLLLTSATMPLSASELAFLRTLSGDLGHRVFLIINKIDQLTATEAARVIEFVRENAANVIPDVRVYPVSSYWALTAKLVASGEVSAESLVDDPMTGGVTSGAALLDGSRFRELERDLFAHLVENKGAMLLGGIAQDASHLVGRLIRTMEADMRAQAMALTDVRAKAQALHTSAELARNSLAESLVSAASGLDAAEAAFLNEARQERATLVARIEQHIDHAGPDELAALDTHALLAADLERWAAQASERVASDVHTAIGEAVGTMNALSQELTAAYDRSFEVSSMEGFPKVSVTDLAVQAWTEDGSSGMSLLQGGLMGIGLALFGPIGVIGAFAGNLFLQTKVDELRINRQREHYRHEVRTAVESASRRLEELVVARIQRVRQVGLHSLRKQAEALVDRFESDVRAVLVERERTETDVAKRDAMLTRRLNILRGLSEELKPFSVGMSSP